MTYHQLIIKAKEWHSKKMPFVLFSLPESKNLLAYFQNTKEKYTTSTYDHQGFVMAPFDYDKTALIIPVAHSEFEMATLPELSSHPNQNIEIPSSDEGKQHHLKIIKEAIAEITVSETKKIVLSRKKEITLTSFDFITLANQIFTKNYNGLKYLWYHPETAIWCGTTPETLLHLNGSSFSTMSLAGTKRAYKDEAPLWTYKEIDEQNIVTSAIFDALQNITPVLKMSKAYAQKAGDLFHLRTDVTGVVRKKNAKIEKFVNALHPTPAVCGTPFESAKDFILKNEAYNRQYYTGFLGNINSEQGGSSLFVNLRSMKIVDNIATMYVGGGIIEKSDSELEWEETQNKLQTMLKVVAPML